MEDLPETFGSYNIKQFEKNTIITAKNNLLDMEDLPETFYSIKQFDINAILI